MKSNAQIVVEGAHCADEHLPVARRIEWYRALAATTASHSLAAHFHHCADDLAAAEQKIGQRTLDFGKLELGNEGI